MEEYRKSLEDFLIEDKVETFEVVGGKVVRQVRTATPDEKRRIIAEITHISNATELKRLERHMDSKRSMGTIFDSMVCQDNTDGNR